MSVSILAANRAFYDAFARRDVAAMDELWARQAPCACVHPGWGALLGREQIMASWAAILTGDPPSLRCVDPVVRLLGERVAFVVCAELVPGGRLIATNTFVLEDGAWKMVHHHASAVAVGEDEEPEPSGGGRVIN